MSLEDYLSPLVRHEALISSGSISLTEYVNSVRRGSDKIAASERTLDDVNKGVKE